MPLPNSQNLSAIERVIKQLLEAVLFENCVEVSDKEGKFAWKLGGREYLISGQRGAFGRYRLDIQSLCIDGVRANVAAHWQQIVEDLPATEKTKYALAEEFSQTAALCEWNRRHVSKPESRRYQDFEILEGSLDEGHPYHPSFKARTGFSSADHEAYGPESSKPFYLCWLAVKRTHIKQNLPQPHDAFWLKELGRTQWLRLSGALSAQDKSWDEYSLLPMHPWQWQQLKQEQLLEPLSDQTLIFLGLGADQYTASQSVRTLMNASYSDRANIKLPLSMVNTSSKRTLAPHSICLAPVVSSWLNRIIESDFELSALSILEEYAGARFHVPGMTSETSPLASEVAVIFRESVQPKLREGESAIPFNALMILEDDGLPFIAGWVETYGLNIWLSRLIDVVVLPVWHLLVKHGIGIEPHGQNMVLVHRDGWPERVIVRDFHESVEYHLPFLANPEWLPDFASIEPFLADAPIDDYYGMSSVELLRELVMDTLFIYSLTEVSFLIEKSYGMSEQSFWNMVGQKLEDYADDHPELDSRLQQLGYTNAQVLTESLMTRKFRGSHAECHHMVPNPFHKYSQK
ncbi:Aerobactin synthase [Grimontia celer]|uniref:Aerobactin synthase n=1 Tax=Grimontia celer TaxID=1796497 RepID=A0A128FFY1_9GAMM|nr:IucA/IucC family protein [Grimontia celer]CZF85405.1 Aerobactin synthase [Grimontia celer]